jgi:hypothetical protein
VGWHDAELGEVGEVVEDVLGGAAV